jgi:hypothetical protein
LSFILETSINMAENPNDAQVRIPLSVLDPAPLSSSYP